jgi:hypothetical protein
VNDKVVRSEGRPSGSKKNYESEKNLIFASFAWYLDGQAHAVTEITDRAQLTQSSAFNILVGVNNKVVQSERATFWIKRILNQKRT